MKRVIDVSAVTVAITLSLLEDYLDRLEDEMKGEAIWEDQAHALRVEQAIVDTKDIIGALHKAVLEAK